MSHHLLRKWKPIFKNKNYRECVYLQKSAKKPPKTLINVNVWFLFQMPRKKKTRHSSNPPQEAHIGWVMDSREHRPRSASIRSDGAASLAVIMMRTTPLRGLLSAPANRRKKQGTFLPFTKPAFTVINPLFLYLFALYNILKTGVISVPSDNMSCTPIKEHLKLTFH